MVCDIRRHLSSYLHFGQFFYFIERVIFYILYFIRSHFYNFQILYISENTFWQFFYRIFTQASEIVRLIIFFFFFVDSNLVIIIYVVWYRQIPTADYLQDFQSCNILEQIWTQVNYIILIQSPKKSELNQSLN